MDREPRWTVDEREVMDEPRADRAPRPVLAGTRPGVFVERATHQWIVLDPEGHFWILPPGDDPWRDRLAFHPTAETSLDPVPGHYKYVLGLPF